MLPTRFEIDGVRHYRTGDKPDRAYPSVTSILSKTAGAKSNQALATWNERNPGAREAAAHRGSVIHAACEDYIRGRAVNVPAEFLPYWEGLSRHLDSYDYFLWSERPLKPEWSFCVGDDSISRIWSHNHRYCGCPDLVGVKQGTIWIADFKTSVGPYSRYYPRADNRSLFGGWNKFSKCAIQLAAYAIAFEETLGVTINMAQMLVSTPETTQSFLLRGHELHGYTCRWLQRVGDYYRQQELEEEVAAIDIQATTVEPELTLALA